MFRKTTIAVAALIFSLSSTVPANAQLFQTDAIRQLRETQIAMRDYAKTHDHFPNGVAEFDDCLKMLVQKVATTRPDSTVAVKTDGKFRTYGGFSISIDYSDVPIVNGIPKVPDYISAPANTIVLNSDAGHNCWGWVAGGDGKPLVLDNGPFYFEETIPAAH